MASGIVVGFHDDRGFGFIRPDGGAGDVFVHARNIANADKLNQGQRVSFEVVTDDRRGTEIRYENFDHLADNFASEVKRAVARTAHIDPNNPDLWGEYIFGLAGWSQKQNAPAFFSVKNAAGDGQEITAVPATKFYSPSAVFEGADDSITRFKFDPGRPGESGLAIMQAQRLQKFSPLGNVGVKHSMYHAIGGFCQYTKISRDGILVKVLERWSDQIGRTVMPVPVMPGSMMGGTFGGR
jgi:cold shock CspA family protein